MTRALPGSTFPLGTTLVDGGANFAVASGADAVHLCLFDDAGTETRVGLTEYDAGVWHGFVAGVAPGQAYGYRMTGPYEPARGLALQPHQAAARPLRPGDRRGGPVRTRGSRLRHRRPRPPEHAGLGGARSAQHRRRSRVRLVGPPPEARVRGHGPLRDPRQGVHGRAPRRPGGAPGHVRRSGARGRAGPPDRAGRHHGRVAAGAPQRARGLPARPGTDQLLGLQHHRLLRPPRGLLGGRPRRQARGAGRRVPGDGGRPARCRPGGRARRGVQPHRRERPPRADAVPPRHRQHRLLPARSRRPRPLPGHDRLRQLA